MLIILTGPDSYRSHVRLEQLRAAFRRKHDPAGLNTITLAGGEATASEIHTAVTASGFFAAKRFVAIDRYPDTAPVCPWPDLMRNLKPVMDTSEVIVVIRREETTTAKRRGKPAEQPADPPGARVEKFPLLEGVELHRWLAREVKNLSATIELSATQLLLEYLGNNTWQLSRELEKLADYSAGRPISATDVKELVAAIEESNIFALTDALGQRQTGRALALLRRELRLGKPVPELLGALANHVWNLYLARQAMDNHRRPAELTEKFGLNPYVVKKSWAQADKFTGDQLRRWHQQIIDIWASQRTGIKPDVEAQLDLLILRD